MDVLVRHAVPGDVVSCFDMWRALVTAEAATFPDGAAYPAPNLNDPTAIGAWFVRFTQALQDPDTRFLVAEVEGAIVGFLLVSHYEREMGEPKQFLHATEMFVKPEFRGTEVYKVLEAAMEEWAKELRVEVIECAAVNTPKQVERWVSRGFTPYMINLHRTAKWKEQA